MPNLRTLGRPNLTRPVRPTQLPGPLHDAKRSTASSEQVSAPSSSTISAFSMLRFLACLVLPAGSWRKTGCLQKYAPRHPTTKHVLTWIWRPLSLRGKLAPVEPREVIEETSKAATSSVHHHSGPPTSLRGHVASKRFADIGTSWKDAQ